MESVSGAGVQKFKNQFALFSEDQILEVIREVDQDPNSGSFEIDIKILLCLMFN